MAARSSFIRCANVRKQNRYSRVGGLGRHRDDRFCLRAYCQTCAGIRLGIADFCNGKPARSYRLQRFACRTGPAGAYPESLKLQNFRSYSKDQPTTSTAGIPRICRSSASTLCLAMQMRKARLAECSTSAGGFLWTEMRESAGFALPPGKEAYLINRPLPVPLLEHGSGTTPARTRNWRMRQARRRHRNMLHRSRRNFRKVVWLGPALPMALEARCRMACHSVPGAKSTIQIRLAASGSTSTAGRGRKPIVQGQERDYLKSEVRHLQSSTGQGREVTRIAMANFTRRPGRMAL